MSDTTNPVTVEQIRRLKKKELRIRANEQLALVDTASADDRELHIHKADLFVRELERRRDYWSWVSWRDLVLEIIVICLIGWEIRLSYQQDTQQSKNFTAQQGVLGTMDTSASKTASAMTTLQTEQPKLVTAQQQSLETLRNTLKSITSMNALLDQQVKMAYVVSVVLTYEVAPKQIRIENQGRTAIYLRGGKVENEPPSKLKDPRLIPAAAYYSLDVPVLFDFFNAQADKNSMHRKSYEFYFLNAEGKQYVLHGYFNGRWQTDKLEIQSTMTSCKPEAFPAGID
jgi:hypothetical protein